MISKEIDTLSRDFKAEAEALNKMFPRADRESYLLFSKVMKMRQRISDRIKEMEA